MEQEKQQLRYPITGPALHNLSHKGEVAFHITFPASSAEEPDNDKQTSEMTIDNL